MLTLRLLRAVLPSWEAGYNVKQQEKLVESLFLLLGEVLVLCNSPFIKPSKIGKGQSPKKLKLHASLTASESSTIAEEIVVLLRRLHPLPAWNPQINQYISSSLQAIPSLIGQMDDLFSTSSSSFPLRDRQKQVPSYFLTWNFVAFCQLFLFKILLKIK